MVQILLTADPRLTKSGVVFTDAQVFAVAVNAELDQQGMPFFVLCLFDTRDADKADPGRVAVTVARVAASLCRCVAACVADVHVACCNRLTC
jgi:hypothetical protein